MKIGNNPKFEDQLWWLVEKLNSVHTINTKDFEKTYFFKNVLPEYYFQAVSITRASKKLQVFPLIRFTHVLDPTIHSGDAGRG